MANRWRCGNCGYRLDADKPPEYCPSCKEACDFIDDNRYVPVDEGGPEGSDPTEHVPLTTVIPESCTGCRKCLPVCPVGAIVMKKDSCTYDFVLIVRPDLYEAALPALWQVTEGFSQGVP